MIDLDFMIDFMSGFLPGILKGLILSVLLAAALYFYNKSRGVKEEKSVYVYTVLFGYIYIIIYFMKEKRKGVDIIQAEQTKKQKRCRIISIVLLAVCIIFSVSSLGKAFNKTYRSITTYECYDKYGNEYSSLDDMIYYTFDDCRFVYDIEMYSYIQYDNSINTIYEQEYEYGYIDKDDNIVFFEEPLNLNNQIDIDEPFCFYDSDEEYYASAKMIYWDESGKVRLQHDYN